MTDNNINHLAKLLEEIDNMPFCTYKEEARWLLENGVIIAEPKNDFCGTPCEFMESIVDRLQEENERLKERYSKLKEDTLILQNLLKGMESEKDA